jgi:alkaline phosphatase D
MEDSDSPPANPDRRRFLALAAALGIEAQLAYATRSRRSRVHWSERRDLFPQGVASGDPHPDSVILWTRRPPVGGKAAGVLTLEVAEDVAFSRVVATAQATAIAEADWTVRVLAAGLEPSRQYFFRFTEPDGAGSRIGRTLTAPAPDDPRPVRFAFASCQMVPAGACNAYRRMMFEDDRAPPGRRLEFVLHLGDFVYEVVWYPEDKAQYYSRPLRDVVRYPTGEKIGAFHVPVTVEDYRALYRAYLSDPDLQDARARWPFVCMWDNHEFSWRGFQSLQVFDSIRPSATRKVAACQAWFEYQPAHVVKSGGDTSLERYVAPPVRNEPVMRFDDHGLGLEANNLAAIDSLKLFRTLRFGRNVELILTDNRSYRSDPVGDGPLSKPFQSEEFPFVQDQQAVEILDAGRTYADGQAPDTIEFGDQHHVNPRKASPPQSMLGAEQKSWFLERLASASAAWKIWGNSVGMLDWRIDFQNLPPECPVRWPGRGYALFSGDDWSGYFVERGEILDFVRGKGITGFVSLAGDRHAFFAGVTSKTLPPQAFEPVGLDFVGASISTPGLGEAMEFVVPKDSPLRAAYLYAPPSGGPIECAADFSVRHGVRASLTLQQTHDLAAALAQGNPNVSPHLSFIDSAGHGYAVVTAAAASIEVEFVCIPRPTERVATPDGGPLRYRVVHRAALWKAGEAPALERVRLDGIPPLGA